MRLTLLHPGAMGATIGAALNAAGHEVVWVSADRSDATRQRADAAGVVAVATLAAALSSTEGVISVCPPHAATAVARSVKKAGFEGTYLDANAVAPATARTLFELIGEGFVDGGIIGPPALRPGTTRLYLSGDRSQEVSGWFDQEVLGVHLVPGGAGAASALKMCYAAYTKGSIALLLGIRALAQAEGVSASLLEEWQLSQPELALRSEGGARGTAGKAWRFVGEMEEIAATFEASNLPGGFHHAAAEIYRRMSGLKDLQDPGLEEVIAALREHRV